MPLAGLIGLSLHLLPEPRPAGRASDFLDSLGANTAISRRGESLAKTIECVDYLGLRWLRSGYENSSAPEDLAELHRKTGVKFSWGLLSGGNDIPKLIATARPLAAMGALLAFEGPNEPNNWGIDYQGQTGGRDRSWKPVAALQRDLYAAVKADAALKRYPVWSISEGGAEVDNVGLQFLQIPKGAKIDMPDGTRYADYANVHNYVYHPNSPAVEDNKTWNAADPTSACRVDGLYGEYGRTWGKGFAGYSESELLNVPRVTTETGATIEGPVTEEIHGLNLLSLYLDQYKRGWSYTAVYLLRDRVDEAGNQRFGFYRPDYSPRKAALYLHNLTTILADRPTKRAPGHLAYTIPNPPPTVHDLLLQKGDGRFELVVWSERVRGVNEVDVEFAEPRAATIYDPTMGTGPIRKVAKTKSIHLSLTDHPVVLEL